MQATNPTKRLGFSLVEMLIVIAVIGVIAAIAVPSITKVNKTSRKNAAMANAKQIANIASAASAAGIQFNTTNDKLATIRAMVEGKEGAADSIFAGEVFQVPGLSIKDQVAASEFLVFDPNGNLAFTGVDGLDGTGLFASDPIPVALDGDSNEETQDLAALNWRPDYRSASSFSEEGNERADSSTFTKLNLAKDYEGDDFARVTKINGQDVKSINKLESGSELASLGNGKFLYEASKDLAALDHGKKADEEFDVTFTNSKGEEITRRVSLGLVGSNPFASDDEYEVSVGDTDGLDVLANDGGDDLRITHLKAGGEWQKISPGQALTLDSGAVVTLNDDGTVDFDATLVEYSSQIKVADNVQWLDPEVSTTANLDQRYDARALYFNGMKGKKLPGNQLAFELNIGGTYDDSIAIDLNGDDKIDYVVTQGDAYQNRGLRYRPWVDASPMSFSVVIKPNSTEVVATWAGQQVIPGKGGPTNKMNTGGGYDRISGMGLKDLGFQADGTIPSDKFTTKTIRVGSLNDAGPGSHNMTFDLEQIAVPSSDSFEYRSIDNRNRTVEGSSKVELTPDHSR